MDKNEVSLPRTGRLAGVDFGTVRIGIAISDVTQTIASPMEVYHRKDLESDSKYFSELAERESLAGFVVGLPVHMSGDESEKSLEARQFAGWLNDVTNLPVLLFDERFSTARANEIMSQGKQTSKRQKQMRDMIAAQVFLDDFLGSNRGCEHPGSMED